MNQKKFNTQYRDHKRYPAKVGSRFKKTYGAAYDDDGRIVLEEKGEENIYSYIQSFKDSVDINVIMKRFASGDVDVLSKVQGFYGDFTGLPENYASMLNLVNDGKEIFESLPAETRAIFHHNFNEFMVAIEDGTLMQKLGHAEPEPSHAEPEPSHAEPEPSPAEPEPSLTGKK